VLGPQNNCSSLQSEDENRARTTSEENSPVMIPEHYPKYLQTYSLSHSFATLLLYCIQIGIHKHPM
jgi:hypothetical protein